MKNLYVFATLLFLALVVVQANAQTVTVTLTDPAGTSVVPILNEPVPGLTAYPGRHAFDARTGGANADQDARNVTTEYDGTTVDYPITSGWQQVNNGFWEPQVVDDGGEWLRVGQNGTNDIQNNVSWDQLFSDPYVTAIHNFDIRISQGDPAVNDKADGFGWKYVNSDIHGTTGAFYTAGEEPNLAGSLGVGFDIWDNGEGDGNATTSLSLHWDGALVKTVNLQTEVDPAFSLETFEPINVTVAVTIPEPCTMTLLLVGFVGICGSIRRRIR